ncbi:hypothetical protein FOT62_22860 [Serratia marcescens]|uniref:Uncharacterized protein n=1 Tax=Serratia marcescens TaxID=615 RepID=A0A5C7BS57_SERMA|nr:MULTISPECIES: hypothetical protein [Serratia]TXE27159.1 hypothetical protein FOT62_22860 [Serratia marcescens]
MLVSVYAFFFRPMNMARENLKILLIVFFNGDAGLHLSQYPGSPFDHADLSSIQSPHVLQNTIFTLVILGVIDVA